MGTNDLVEVVYTSNVAGNLHVGGTDTPDLTWYEEVLRLVLPRHGQQHCFSQRHSNDHIQLSAVYHHLCYNISITVIVIP